MLDRAAEACGSRIALRRGCRRPSHLHHLSRTARRRAAGRRLLETRGVKPGNRVLLIAENSPEWVLGYFAILYAGAIAVPLYLLVAADELAPVCRIAQPRAALLSAECKRRLGVHVREAQPILPNWNWPNCSARSSCARRPAALR